MQFAYLQFMTNIVIYNKIYVYSFWGFLGGSAV